VPDKRSIPVQILGQEYRIRSDGDEDLVRRAAALVDETMARVRSRTGTVDTQSVAVLAALNIANHLLVSRERRTDAEPAEGLDPESLGPLIEMVEAALRDEAPPAH
jgi:cell division protein ZapA (FtsZ GTPase activity inhibitor)